MLIDGEKLLERLPFWDELIELDRAKVRATAHTRHFAKGQLLYCPGCDCLGMILVLSGAVRAYIVSEEGREITLFHLREGDPCVLSASCAISQITFETAMVAQEDTDLLVIPVNTFEALISESLKVRCFAYELLTQRMSTIMWVMQHILFLRFDQRVARFLLNEAERINSGELRITQEGIAEQINASREAVARQLARFVEDGLVKTSRGMVRILDRRRLSSLLES